MTVFCCQSRLPQRAAGLIYVVPHVNSIPVLYCVCCKSILFLEANIYLMISGKEPLSMSNLTLVHKDDLVPLPQLFFETQNEYIPLSELRLETINIINVRRDFSTC